MKSRKLLSFVLGLTLMVFFTGICFAGTLTEITKRGELRVAVQFRSCPLCLCG